ncbi:MAG: VOC family protein [Marinobacter sp.]|uniref:VOC family protein n=1 Tax=Marinobacter sp. TaxID=50741 RepID=UPI00299D55C5|nr:VOC family protein [Marinobacter sp.]MDX1756135.1 VOC family protein [Marinobacter sp.]
MPQAIYVNLPVTDLVRSMTFFQALGFSFNPKFTNDQAAGLEIADTIFAMLHTPDSFRRFTHKQIADSRNTTEVLIALQLESKDRVNTLMDQALAAGAREYREPEDHGFMFGRTFEDLDGHIWELFWLDIDQMPSG